MNRRILIVEDEDEARKGYAMFLNPAATQGAKRVSSRQAQVPKPSEAEFDVVLASSGEEAIELFKKALANKLPFAGGFFDVKLGAGIDGLETIRTLKTLDPRLRCVVVTAYHDREVDEIQTLFGDAFKSHWDYLNKPFTQGEIVQKGRQMVAAWNGEEDAKALQAQLIQSEKLAAVGHLARSIGHEFGNILLRIMGKADIALQEPKPEKMSEHLQVIKKASERAAVIVRNMQSFSKTSTPGDSTHLTDLSDLNEVVQEALSLMSHEFVKHSVKVELKLQSKAKTALDRGAIAQVLLNLMINATHAMPKGGTLTLETLESPQSITCRVTDTGIGIAKDIAARIFEYGFSTKGDKGSGLGLALSRQIIEAHGGQLTVASELGKGSTFSVTLPLGTS